MARTLAEHVLSYLHRGSIGKGPGREVPDSFALQSKNQTVSRSHPNGKSQEAAITVKALSREVWYRIGLKPKASLLFLQEALLRPEGEGHPG